MSYVATGFWLGITMGRLILHFPATKYGEKKMVLVYTFIALCIQFVFWYRSLGSSGRGPSPSAPRLQRPPPGSRSDVCCRFVPSVPVSAVSVALIGFFIGPIFPCAVALATKVLPGHLHVSVIGFIAAFGTPRSPRSPWPLLSSSYP